MDYVSAGRGKGAACGKLGLTCRRGKYSKHCAELEKTSWLGTHAWIFEAGGVLLPLDGRMGKKFVNNCGAGLDISAPQADAEANNLENYVRRG